MKWERVTILILNVYVRTKPFIGGCVALLVVLEPLVAIQASNSLVLLMAIDSVIAGKVMENSYKELENLREEVRRLSDKMADRESTHVKDMAEVKIEVSSLKTDVSYIKNDVAEIKVMINEQNKVSRAFEKETAAAKVDSQWQKDIWKYVLGALGGVAAILARELFSYLGK